MSDRSSAPALLTLAPQYLAGLEQYQNLVFFVFLLVLILVWPSGLFGRVRDCGPLETMLPVWLRRRRRPARAMMPAPA